MPCRLICVIGLPVHLPSFFYVWSLFLQPRPCKTNPFLTGGSNCFCVCSGSGSSFYLPSYLHLSDALLVTAGRPSRGRRRLAVRLIYVVSLGFLLLLAGGCWLVRLCQMDSLLRICSAPLWTEFFTVYYIGIMVWAGYNFMRAFARMLTRSGQRRMLYLMAGATAPALGSYPYLLFGSDTCSEISALLLEHSVYYQRAWWRFWSLLWRTRLHSLAFPGLTALSKAVCSNGFCADL